MELTDKEKIEKAKKEKIILHGNTRISKAPWRSEKQMDKLRREVEHKEALAAGKVGIDGKELVRPETPSVNGFKLMSMTPSPALGNNYFLSIKLHIPIIIVSCHVYRSFRIHKIKS